MSMQDRPIPRPTALSKPFWDGTREGRLRLQKCRDCGAFRWSPQWLCIACHSENFDWTECSGRGTVYSYTIVERPPLPSFEPGYVLAVVELEEGPLMLTNIVDCPREAARIGLPVEVAFEKATEEITLYKFRPSR